MDVGGGVMESRTEAATASATPGTQRTFWRAGADGWKLSRLVGGARTGRLFDRYGRRRHQHNVGATRRARDHLGGSGRVACMDRALWGAIGVVRGLEELVQAGSHGAGAVARGTTDHAVWSHVRKVGDRADCGQFAAGQGTCGAGARDASGSTGEETTAEGDQPARSGQRVSRTGVFAGTQPAICAGGRKTGRLSSTCAASCGVGSHFPFGERAHGQRRLGGTLRQPLFPTAAARSTLPPDAGQSAGRRGAARADHDRVSRSCAELAGDSRARKTALTAGRAQNGAESTETDSIQPPSVARAFQSSRTEKAKRTGHSPSAPAV